MQGRPLYALSIKQPWATLLVHGRKTVEVRGWPTCRRGRVLIHAGRVPDRRAAAWEQVPAPLRQAALLGGGIVGAAELTGCLVYRSREEFAADRDRHLNDPAWFDGRPLYGFLFAGTGPLPFRRCPGNLYFFPVAPEAAGDTRSG